MFVFSPNLLHSANIFHIQNDSCALNPDRKRNRKHFEQVQIVLLHWRTTHFKPNEDYDAD